MKNTILAILLLPALAACATAKTDKIGDLPTVKPVQVPELPSDYKKAVSLPPLKSRKMNDVAADNAKTSREYNVLRYRYNALIDIYNCVRMAANEKIDPVDCLASK